MKSTLHGATAPVRAPSASASYPAEQPEASGISEASFPAVPYDDPAWDDPSTWELGPWFREGDLIATPRFPHMVRSRPKEARR